MKLAKEYGKVKISSFALENGEFSVVCGPNGILDAHLLDQKGQPVKTTEVYRAHHDAKGLSVETESRSLTDTEGQQAKSGGGVTIVTVVVKNSSGAVVAIYTFVLQH